MLQINKIEEEKAGTPDEGALPNLKARYSFWKEWYSKQAHAYMNLNEWLVKIEGDTTTSYCLKCKKQLSSIFQQSRSII